MKVLIVVASQTGRTARMADAAALVHTGPLHALVRSVSDHAPGLDT